MFDRCFRVQKDLCPWTRRSQAVFSKNTTNTAAGTKGNAQWSRGRESRAAEWQWWRRRYEGSVSAEGMGTGRHRGGYPHAEAKAAHRWQGIRMPAQLRVQQRLHIARKPERWATWGKHPILRPGRAPCALRSSVRQGSNVRVECQGR